MIIALVLNLLLFWFVTVLISQNHRLKIVEFVLWVVGAQLLGVVVGLMVYGMDGPGWARGLIAVAVTSLVLAAVVVFRAGERQWKRVVLIVAIYFAGSNLISTVARVWTETTVNRAVEQVQEPDQG